MSDEQGRIWVGAFGKHPGWDDHIADQGLETELLTRVKRLLYLEGIGGNIDSGAWAELDPDEHLDGFDHVFLWRWAGGLVAGRLWSSSDGKGRTRYPMIVCAHCRGLAGEWVAGPCLDALDDLATNCRAATDAAGVMTAVDDARRNLRSAAATAPLASTEPLSTPAALAQIADCEQMNAEALSRVVYQLEREFSSFLLTDLDSGTRSRTIDVRPRHMRVPACRDRSGEACDLWLRFLLERTDPVAPLVAIVRRGEGTCDLIAGEPTRGQFACLQSSLKRVPLTTEIPYTIDEAFADRVSKRVEAARTGDLRDIDPGHLVEAPTRTLRTPVAPDRSQIKLIGMVAAAVIVVFLLIFAVIKIAGNSGGGGSGTPDRDRATSRSDSAVDDDVSPAVLTSDEITKRVEAFQDWSRSFGSWFGPLATVKGSDREILASDAYLNEHVLAPIERAREAGIVFDPLGVVNNPPPTVFSLVSDPPAEVSTTAVWDRTQRAQSVIGEVRAGLLAWPIRERVMALADRLDAAGVVAPVADLRAAAEAASPNGGGAIMPAIEALVLAENNAAVLDAADRIESIVDAIEVMRTSDDAVLREEAETLHALLEGVRSSADVTQFAERAITLNDATQLATSISSFARTAFADVDTTVFESQSAAHTGSERGIKRLRQWLADAKRPEMQKLDPALDPRLHAEIETRLAELDHALGLFDEQGRTAYAAEIESLEARRAALGESAATIHDLAWNSSNRGGIESGMTTLARDIARLDRDTNDLRAVISVDIAEKLADLRSRDLVSTSGLDAIDELWRIGRKALLERYSRDDNHLALFRDARTLRERLQHLEDTTLTLQREFDLPVTWDRGAVQARQDNARNKAVSTHARAVSAGAIDDEGFEEIVSLVRSYTEDSLIDLAALIDSIATVQSLVDGLHAFDEEPHKGESMRALLASMGEEHEAARLIAPVLYQSIDALQAVMDASQERDELVSILNDSRTTDASAFASWRALSGVTPVWPGSLSELESDLILASRIRTASSGVSDAVRRSAIEAAVAETLRQRWVTAANASADRAELLAIKRLRENCGGHLAALADTTRFNLGVDSIEQAIDSGEDDDVNRARLRSALASFESLELNEQADAWLTEVAQLADEEADQVPPLDPSSVGPARAGWRVVEGSTEERLVYERTTGDQHRLAFRLVTLADGRASYVCETELSVGVVAGLVDDDLRFAQELITTLDGIGLQSDERRGMSTWVWMGSEDAPALSAAESWVSVTWIAPDEYAVDGGNADYPSLSHPLQRIALSDAMFIAARLGCRLPTVDEWRAAHASVPSAQGWNVRDQRFARQVEHVRSIGADWSDSKLAALMPDFNGQSPLAGDPVYPNDDGQVWLSEVDAGPDAAFRHIVGNVHEYVIIDFAGQVEAMGSSARAPSDEDIKRWFPIARKLKAGVIGGSLFSRSDAPATEVTPVDDLIGGATDVGVRLAFSSESGRVQRSVASRIRALIDRAPFLTAE